MSFRKWAWENGRNVENAMASELMDAMIDYLDFSANTSAVAELRGTVKALQDEIRNLNRRILELSLNASVEMGK